MFCSNCGNQLKSEQRFCNMCGKPVPSTAPVVEPTPVVQPAPVAEPTPVVQPEPVAEPTPAIQPAPVAEPTPVVQPEPVAEPTPAVQPEPVAEPTPVVQPAPTVVPIADNNPPKKKGVAGKIAVAILIVAVLAGGIFGAFQLGKKLSGNSDNSKISKEASVSESISESVEASLSKEIEDTSVEPVVEEKEVTTTVLVYMIGSNLESQRGYASQDILEMLNANISENVNVVIQTGGCKKWSNPNIKANNVQRFHIEDGELVELENLGKISMVENDTLSDFISYGASEYPADRYYLILWDHGGGDPVVGFGVDELFPGDMITYNEFPGILKKAGVHLDAVITDACDMCTLEVALSINDYVDYLVASEQSMPGTGTYYTGWLGKTNDLTTEETCITIAKEYKKSLDAMGQIGCISVIDCSKTDDVMTAYGAFLTSVSNTDINEYYTNRDKCGSNELDIIDIISLASWYKTTESKTLQKKTEEAVVFYDGDTKSTYGLAAYSPYKTYASYSDARKALEAISYDDAAIAFYDSFASLMYVAYERSVPSEKWYDETFVAMFFDESDYSTASSGSSGSSGTTGSSSAAESVVLTTTEVNGYYCVELTDEIVQNLTYFYEYLYVKYEDSYLIFGSDVIYGVDMEGSNQLYWDLPTSWVGVNNTPIPFFTISFTETGDGQYQQLSEVDALINDESAYLIIYMDNDCPSGRVYGYVLADDETDTIYPLEDTDVIQLYVKTTDDKVYSYMSAMNASDFILSYVESDLSPAKMYLTFDCILSQPYRSDYMIFE